MATPTMVSLEEYMHTMYHPDMEYADGVLIRRNVGTQLHGLLQTILAAFLHQQGKRLRFKVFTETRVQIVNRRYVIPDVMVVEEPFARGKVVTDVPAVVFEIQSPDDTLNDVFQKCLTYAALEVPNIIVLDPDRRRQYVFADQAMHLVTSIVLRFPKSGAELPLPSDEMFAELSEDAS